MSTDYTCFAKSVHKLMKTFPELKNVTTEKHKKNGTIVLLNRKMNRKYFIYKSGFAKAVSAENNCESDLINAWACKWRNCLPMTKPLLIQRLHAYIHYHNTYPRDYQSSQEFKQKLNVQNAAANQSIEIINNLDTVD